MRMILNRLPIEFLKYLKKPQTSPIFKLIQLEPKEPYIISDLQDQLNNKLESTIVFNNVSGKEIQVFVLFLIQEARKSLMKFSLQS